MSQLERCPDEALEAHGRAVSAQSGRLLIWFAGLAGLFFCLELPVTAVGQPSSLQPGRTELLFASDNQIAQQPRWSPDGTALAFTSADYSGVWILDVRDGSVMQVTDEAAAGFGVAWSSDGSSLLARVARFDGPRRFNAVKVFNREADRASLLTDYRARMPSLPVWSENDAHVLLVDRLRVEVLASGLAAGKAASDVEQVLLSGGRFLRTSPATRQVEVLESGTSDGEPLNLSVSPSGNQIAFEELGGNLKVASADLVVVLDLGRGHRPRWSPDGEWIVFVRSEDDGYRITASDLYAARADGSSVVQLTETTGRVESNPDWSPDGTRIAFDADGALFVMRLLP